MLSKLVERLTKVVTKRVFDVFLDFLLALPGASEKARCSRGLRAFDSFQVIERYFRAFLCLFQNGLQGSKGPGYRTDAHGRAISPTVVGTQAQRKCPMGELFSVTSIWIARKIILHVNRIIFTCQNAVGK